MPRLSCERPARTSVARPARPWGRCAAGPSPSRPIAGPPTALRCRTDERGGYDPSVRAPTHRRRLRTQQAAKMTQPTAQDPKPLESTRPERSRAVLTALILVAAVANLNLAVANVALPDIGKAFDAGQTALNLVAVGYSLGLAASVLYLGALGDRHG